MRDLFKVDSLGGLSEEVTFAFRPPSEHELRQHSRQEATSLTVIGWSRLDFSSNCQKMRSMRNNKVKGCKGSVMDGRNHQGQITEDPECHSK